MKLKKYISTTLVLALTVGALVGCSNSDEGSKGESAPPKSKDEIVIAVMDEPESGFDATVGSHGSLTRVLFSTLFKRDKDLGIENDLATEYKVSEDRLTWTVKIRDDVKFSDGEKLTSDDVVYTYEVAKESGSSIDLTMLESVTAVDEYTIDFKLKNPQSTFIEKMAYIGIVPEHAHNEGFADNPIGSGPYEFVQWDKGQQVIVEANESYYEDAPSIKKMTMVFLDDDAAYSAVKAGEVDLASIPGTFAQEEIEGKQIISLDSIETYGVKYTMIESQGEDENGFPVGNDVTSDKAIREALTYAVDREMIVEGVLEGYGAPSSTGLEKMPWLNEETVIDPEEDGDIEKAKKILEDGGWKDTNNNGTVDKDGVEAEFKLVYTDGKYRQELCLAYIEVAKELGIKVDLEMTTWDNIEEDVYSSAVLFGWGSGDPSEIYNLYSSKVTGTGIPWHNSGYYKNDKVDEYIDQALQSENEEEAIEHWKKAQWDGETGASTNGDCPYTWMANANHVFIADENLDIGEPVVQPHGGRILDNVTEWTWK